MNFTEGFGKKWIERILGKVDKDQGVANAGKVLGIGNDGQVVPVEQSGGSGSGGIEVLTFTNASELKDAYMNGKIQVGDIVEGNGQLFFLNPQLLTVESEPLPHVTSITYNTIYSVPEVYGIITGIDTTSSSNSVYLNISVTTTADTNSTVVRDTNGKEYTVKSLSKYRDIKAPIDIRDSPSSSYCNIYTDIVFTVSDNSSANITIMSGLHSPYTNTYTHKLKIYHKN